MPKVSELHRANRREEILDAATICFSSKGFHATSMGDIIDVSGLSTGAIYSYFKSKQDIANAVAQRAIGEYASQALLELVNESDTAPGPADALNTLYRELDAQGIPASLILQLWGEAINDDSFRKIVIPSVLALFDVFHKLLVRWGIETGRVTEDEAEGWASVTVPTLAAFGQGYIVQKALLPDFDSESYLQGIRILTEGMTDMRS